MDAGEEGAWCHQCSEGEPPVKKQRELSLRRRAQKGNQQIEVALGVGVHLCLTGLLLPQVTVPFQTESLYRESRFVCSFCMYVPAQSVSEVAMAGFLKRVDVYTCALQRCPQ